MRPLFLSLLIALFCVHPAQALPENITQTIVHNAGPFALHIAQHVGWGVVMLYATTLIHEFGHGAVSLMSGTPFKLIIGDPRQEALFDSKYLKIVPSNPFYLTSTLAAIQPRRSIPKYYDTLTMLAGPLAGVIFSGKWLSDFVKQKYMAALIAKPHNWPLLVSSNTFRFEILLFILLGQLSNLLPLTPGSDGDKLLKNLGVSWSSRQKIGKVARSIVYPSLIILPLVLGTNFANGLESVYQAGLFVKA